WPILNLSLSGNATLSQLYDVANDTVAPRLRSVNGVAQVNVVGGLRSEVQILVDATKIQSFGLTLQHVKNAIGEDHLSSPGGTVYQGDTQFGLRSSALLTSVEQFEDIVISSGPSGNVYLRDVARVEDTHAPQRTIQRFNGRSSVGLSIIQQSGANIVQTVELVEAELARLKRSVPRGMSFSVTNDRSRFTRASIEAVQTDLMIAVVICGLVLLAFLHAWRNTVIVLLSIPTSMIATFFAMYLLGFSLNNISLMALALLVGLLVDDSIVVLENIHRHRKLGEEPLLASLNGRSEIGAAAIAITLTDVVVFAPIAFIPGILGQFLREFGLTVVIATLFSLFISFTLVPMLTAHWLKPEKVDQINRGSRRKLTAPFRQFGPSWDAGLERLQVFYQHVLSWSLAHRPVVVLIGLGSLGAALAFIPLHLVGTEYAPIEDDGQFNMRVRMPPGISLLGTDEAMAQLENQLMDLPEVEGVFSSVGGRRPDAGRISVQLIDKRDRQRSSLEVVEEARQIGRSIPGMIATGNVSRSIGGSRSPINIRILGDDLTTLDQIASQVLDIVRATPGTVDVSLQELSGVPEVVAEADRARMAPLGITPADLARDLRTAVTGTVVGRLERPGERFSDLRVKLDGAETMSPAELGSLPIFAPATDSMVRLDQVATLRLSTGPSQINRAGQRRRLTVVGDVDGRPLGDVARDIRAEFRELELPPGYRVVFVGQVNRMQRAFKALLLSLAVSALLVYMLLAALYEDLLRPLAIMFSIPLALIGAFLGLWISGSTFNLFSMLGMILLMALVAKNAILLVDFTDTLRKRGVDRTQAIVEAGATRLRPILMTTFTLVFAMIPLSLNLAPGSEARSPIAVVIIGGVISSMLLTLVVVPVVYTLLDDILILARRLPDLSRRLRGQPVEAPVAPLA
ncbi:MAG: efflux RND transporter permease subunit, partial [Chloroflexi bacterium]|nr:efflux RND transporter permease subunit [Chloroflexota bacterium]